MFIQFLEINWSLIKSKPAPLKPSYEVVEDENDTSPKIKKKKTY